MKKIHKSFIFMPMIDNIIPVSIALSAWYSKHVQMPISDSNSIGKFFEIETIFTKNFARNCEKK